MVFFPGVFGGVYFNVGKVVLLKRKFPASWLRKGSKLGSTDSISSDHVAQLAVHFFQNRLHCSLNLALVDVVELPKCLPRAVFSAHEWVIVGF